MEALSAKLIAIQVVIMSGHKDFYELLGYVSAINILLQGRTEHRLMVWAFHVHRKCL